MSAGEMIVLLVIVAFFIGAALMGVARPWDPTDAAHHPDILDADAPVPPSEESPI
ncbi:hypothetical protein GCM10011584_16910 [Nocardioides phosphati]|uniref:Cbb3-type cytochrome c oxidase subunit 3 n=1 Tax=Nocardioides phosphati TaxID=1867775 RepID=A0ABQ2NA52_9ACTN|nr:hypothetical protein [Nocardioides phosphati]GGO88869.1 hypothetical protein GCM10011584_16910 [Nocardioides phosphati]